MQHISGYNDLMNKTFITDLRSTWNGQGWRFMSLPILELASPSIPPLGTFPIAVSYSWRAFWQFQPHQTLLLLAVTLHSSSPWEYWQHSFSVLCQDSPSTPGSPSLSPLLPADPCSPLVLGVKELERWTCKKQFFFLIISQGLGLGFFSGLLYLWVESCDSVTVSPQCYKLLHRWWLYQLVVFYIHTAFSIKGVGIGSHL